MAVTRSLADGTTLTARGVPDPDTKYRYAVVVTFEGPLASLAQQSAEAAARDELSARRTVSWVRRDEGGLRVQLTRSDPAFAARVTDRLLAAADATLEERRRRFDDGDFDRALRARASDRREADSAADP